MKRRPLLQLALAGLVMVGGAYLIALWAVGVVLIVEGLFYVLMVWDDGKSSQVPSRLQTVLEQYRRSA